MSISAMEDGVYFTIREVAEQVGVVSATIRNWEKEGLFTAKRTASGYRIYSIDDIEQLKTIRRYSKDESMGMNAIRRFINASQPRTLSHINGESSAASRMLISQKWKDCRTARGYALDDVALEVGISPSYLSKIENGGANVSYDILRRLAEFYGENILYFMSTEGEDERNLVRQNEAEFFSTGIDGVSLVSLVALKKHSLSSVLYTAQPGAGRATEKGHSGAEFVHILQGRVKMEVNGQGYIMRLGDSISYNSNVPHGWLNCGKTIAKILWVYTPFTHG